MTPLAMCFNTGFYRDGAIIMIRKEIMVDYLKTWFMVDLICTFPYTWAIDGCILENCDTVRFT